MAGPPKKKALEPKDESSGEESDAESYNGDEEVQVDFEGRNPESQDFHGIKQLLQQLFLKAHLDLSQMSDMLIEQAGIGSVLKQTIDDDDDEDDDLTDSLDVFGITSVLNVSSHKDSQCIQQLINLLFELSKEHADNSVQAEISNLFVSGKKVGLLINERFVNIPAKISDPLFSSLLGEIERMKIKKPEYDFDYLIMICKLHKAKKSGEVFYTNAEEEIFAKEAQVSFEFGVETDSDSSVGGKWREEDIECEPFRRVLFIPGNKFNGIVQKIKQFLA